VPDSSPWRARLLEWLERRLPPAPDAPPAPPAAGASAACRPAPLPAMDSGAAPC
jgi:hypothetical protein